MASKTRVASAQIRRQRLFPQTAASHDKVEMVAPEHHEGMLSAIAHISGRVVPISVRPRLSPMLQPLLSEACPHSQNTPFDLVRIQQNHLQERPTPDTRG